MDEKDIKKSEAEIAEDKKELKKEVEEKKVAEAQAKEELKEAEEAKEAMQEEMQEEIENFAETSPEMGPNSFWGSAGTWWVLAIAGILIIFLVIWVCFFYGPN